MECDEVVSRLWEYLDRALAGEEAAAVGAHLVICPNCHPPYCHSRSVLALIARASHACGTAPRRLVLAVRLITAAPE